MKTDRSKFIALLKSLRPGTAQRDIIEQLSHVFFTGKMALTFNDKICIGHPFATDFECSVHCDNLISILDKTSGDSIEMKVKKDSLIITDEVSEVEMPIDKNMSVAGSVSPPEGKKWKKLPKDFIEGLQLCAFSASKDMTRKALSCVSISEKDITSSDNLRISWFEMSETMGKGFLIPRESAIELSSFPVISFIADGPWVHFSTKDEVVFSARIVAEDYPDVTSYFEIEEVAEVTLPKGLKGVVEDVSVILDDKILDDKKLFLEINKKEIICSGSSNKGAFKKKLVSDTKLKKPVSFVVNPQFLSQILAHTTTMILGEDKAIFFTDSFKHIMCLPVQEEAE